MKYQLGVFQNLTANINPGQLHLGGVVRFCGVDQGQNMGTDLNGTKLSINDIGFPELSFSGKRF